jgi:hypothetical protein
MNKFIRAFRTNKRFKEDFLFMSWLMYDMLVNIDLHSRANDGAVLPEDTLDYL